MVETEEAKNLRLIIEDGYLYGAVETTGKVVLFDENGGHKVTDCEEVLYWVKHAALHEKVDFREMLRQQSM